ncbi:hypothetical protein Glove_330g4 [Diversispora epigaea]|uniref:Uncharacterized protein n=1 Tax=Diversispora epigaea TaxID=1348612 RepID=A0A397HQ56_9GLOM|nr:hypothetical protein Glove_330g4 [Diversispora epigaea]
MSSNIVNLNEDSFETQTVDESCINIDENDIDEVVLVSKIFEFNEIEIEYNENLESDSEYNFESDSSDNEKELKNKDDENDIIIEQKLSNNLTPCVIIDKIDGKIQRCKNVKSFRKLWQLIEVWQIDSDVILEANGFLENLGVCSYHFNHDQNKLHNSKDKQLKSISVSILNRRECYPICKLAFEDIKNPRYICSECYELEGGHFHVKPGKEGGHFHVKPGKGKLSVSCIKQKYHDDDVKKNIEIIAHKINKNQFDISVSTNQTQSIAKSSNIPLDTLIPALTKLPSFFIVQTLTRLNRIPIYPDEKELEERDFEKFGEILPIILTSLCRRPKLISSLYSLLTKCSILGHTNRHERRLEKNRMQNINSTKILVRGNNVFNLAVIDNIDFKEASFEFGNIYDVTYGSSHITLRMVFQSILPISINEILHETRELNVDTHLFGMTPEMDSMQNKIDQSFEKLLNYQINANGDISYNKNLDVEMVENEILTQCKYGCLISPPNVVILTPTGSPNDDNEIFCATQMYKEEFLLNDNQYLDICEDEVIFRRLIKACQWHTSKDMLSVLLTIFSSYGIFHLVTAIGVRFLDKFQAVVDYRSTRRVMELIWVAVGIAIHIYIKKKNINIENILMEKNICIKVWYLYYKYFSM